MRENNVAKKERRRRLFSFGMMRCEYSRERAKEYSFNYRTRSNTNDYRSFFESVVLGGEEEEEGFFRSRRRVSAAAA